MGVEAGLHFLNLVSMQNSKKSWKRVLRLLGPIIFILLFLRVVDTRATLNILKDIRPDMALVSILLFPMVNAALTIRWWLICRRLELNVFFNWLFQITYISWFLSAIPLVGISPLSKLLYLKAERKPAGLSVVSIACDKLFDVLGLVAFGLFGLVYFPRGLFKETYLWMVPVTVVLPALILLLFGRNIWNVIMQSFKRYTNKRLQKIESNLEEDLRGFWSGFNVRFFMLILAISIAIGLLRSLVLYILAVALGINVGFGLIVACRAVIGIVNVIPISISGLGTRDAVLLMTLPLAGVSKEAAIALGLLAFVWTIGSKFSGIFFWLKRPLPSRSILDSRDKAVS
jgi:uncharacterized protein (TIRG00374 family)